jgi:hypothetical protein
LRAVDLRAVDLRAVDLRAVERATLHRAAAHLDDLLARLDPNRKENRVNAGTRYAMRRAAGRIRPADSKPGGRVALTTCRFLVRNSL